MIIGLMGYAGSGKDEVAKILVEQYGFKRLAFADKIREILYEVNPMVGGEPLQIRVDADGWDKAKQHPEVRRLLQKVGVACRNHLSASVWIAPVLRDINPGERVVITDIRFNNEVEVVKKGFENSEIWRVERPGVGPVNNHVSEKELDNISADRTLLNSGTLNDLEVLVKLRLDSYLAYQNN